MENAQRDEKRISAASAIGYSIAGTMLLIFSGSFTSGFSKVLPPYGYFIRFVVYVALVYGCSRYLAKCCGFSLTECRITKVRLTLRGVFVAVFLPVVVLLWNIHGEPGHFVYNQMPKEQVVKIILYLLFWTGFCSGIVEEMMFRGVLTRICEERFGKKMAFLIPTLLFALPHVRNYAGGFSIICGLVCLVSISSLFTVLMYQSGSIWDSVLVHAVWDIFPARSYVYVVSSSVHEDAFFTYLLDNKTYHPLMNVSSEQHLLTVSAILLIVTGGLILLGKLQHNRRNGI